MCYNARNVFELAKHHESAKQRCGLYVHIPFCKTKCGYCDFYSVPTGLQPTRPLVDRVCTELEHRLADHSLRMTTVFVGGGTPTLLPPADLRALLETLSRCVVITDLEEFTVEANPASVDDRKAALLVENGVGRVSMGAQSYFPKELEALERIHCPDDIGPSVELLRRHGIGQVNLDLMFGIPSQSLVTWRESLARTIDLGVDHISAYGLTYEPGTRLTAMRRAGHVTPCDEDLETDMYLLAIDVLNEAGFEQYEISNFARPGCRCSHNLNYWRNGAYVGVGPSASGFVHGRRYKNVPDIVRYVRMMDQSGTAEIEAETPDVSTLAMELVMMQLRLVEGLSIELFHNCTGEDPLGLFQPLLDRFVEDHLVVISDSHISLTRTGRLVANEVIRQLSSACELAVEPTA